MSDTGIAGAASTTGPDGLTADEVAERVRAGQVNVADDRTSRTLAEIVRANVFTRFNAILGTMFVLILVFGEGQDALFGFVLVFNALIGIVQEWRAKRTLDRLAVLVGAAGARRARRRRRARSRSTEVVLDDLLELRAGDQVAGRRDRARGRRARARRVDAHRRVRAGRARTPGDEVLSGSIVVAGPGRFQATRGRRRRVRRAGSRPRRAGSRSTRSELVDGINRILQLRAVGARARPRSCSRSASSTCTTATREAIAGVVAGRRRDGARRARAADEPRVRGRGGHARAAAGARAGAARRSRGWRASTSSCSTRPARSPKASIRFRRARTSSQPDDPVADALGALAADENRNATMNALCEAFPAPDGWERTGVDAVLVGAQVERGDVRRPGHVGARRAGDGVGRPRRRRSRCAREADRLAADGQRVLLLARTDAALVERGAARRARRASALVLFEEQIRRRRGRHARSTSRDQGVRCKVISGDNPRTVGAVAARVGIAGADRAVRRARAPRRSRRARRGARGHVGVRAGHAATEAGDRRRAADAAGTSSR